MISSPACGKNQRARRTVRKLQVIRGVSRKMCSAAARDPLMWGQARLHYSGSADFAFWLEGLPQVAAVVYLGRPLPPIVRCLPRFDRGLVCGQLNGTSTP